ncbi:MAG: DNA-3-methyladenine glycosylase [Candidatus Saccharibacteria bacterium]|nr:DNA-3-methyladenine glycosylase [Candidatus Saccharibacteria bacterium]
MKTRCEWAIGNKLYEHYHDTEWGVPLHDDRELYGYLLLEGAQAGLSWQTILQRRDNYRKAFAQFDPDKVARFGEKGVETLLQDSSIIRNRLKIRSAIDNAQKFLEIQEEFGSFNDYQWQFVGGHAIQNEWQTLHDAPALSPEAEAFSEDLRSRGFTFVGPKIIYAHMQAVGMVNDHIVSCFRYEEVKQLT